jgi:hypothetical protein
MSDEGQKFKFVTASYLDQISPLKAIRLADLPEGLERCSDASIFFHTFQSLGRYHFLTEGFSNDFAQWALAACNCGDLAEQLAVLDIRDYLSLADLRRDLGRVIADYCRLHPEKSRQEAFEPFYFCESIEVTVPLGWEAGTLREFRDGVARLSHASFHYHFITSRLRLHLRSNDFSQWLAGALGQDTLARRASRIDIYTNTLESARATLLGLVDQELRP